MSPYRWSVFERVWNDLWVRFLTQRFELQSESIIRGMLNILKIFNVVTSQNEMCCPCWLIRAWPRFKDDFGKQILVLLALSAIVHRARTEVSPEVVWEGVRTRFPHPRDVLMKVLKVRDPNQWATLLHAIFYSSQPMCTFENTILFRSDPYCVIILVLNLVYVAQIFLLLIQLLDKRAYSKKI